MKFSIEMDEAFPVVVLRKPTTKRGIYDVPKDILSRFQAADKAYWKAQKEMTDWYCEQSGHEEGYFGACWCGEVKL